MADFDLKANDTQPDFTVQLLQAGAAFDMSALSGVACTFTMTAVAGGAAKVNKAAMTIDDAANGQISYSWAAADTDTDGTYEAEVEVTWTGGNILTFPTDGYFDIDIEADLA